MRLINCLTWGLILSVIILLCPLMLPLFGIMYLVAMFTGIVSEKVRERRAERFIERNKILLTRSLMYDDEE